MQQPREVAVLFGRHIAVARKATVLLKTVLPVFQRKGRIGNGKIKAPENRGIIFVLIKGIGEGVTRIDLTSSLIVQNKIHLCKTRRGYLLFLTVNGHLKGRFIRRADEQRARAAGGVVHTHVCICYLINTYDLGKNA